MEEVTEKQHDLGRDVPAGDIVGKRVLSRNGYVVGRVSDIVIGPSSLKLEGIVVSRGLRGLWGLLKKPLILGREYFQSIKTEAILLNIEPSVLLEGKRVITYDGEVLGRVSEVVRHGKTNAIKDIIVKPFLKRQLHIPLSAIHMINKSIVLKQAYHAKGQNRER